MPIALRGLAINIKSLLGRTFLQRAVIVALILVLLLGAILYWRKIPEVDWRFLLGKLAIEKPTEETKKAELGKGLVIGEELLITIPGKVYEKTAQPGEGITHLARRALKTYLEEKGRDFNLTPEHKIYIEDYIQKKTGSGWLMLGETLTFSEELIVEAINKAQQLTPDQLENLKQYS